MSAKFNVLLSIEILPIVAMNMAMLMMLYVNLCMEMMIALVANGLAGLLLCVL